MVDSKNAWRFRGAPIETYSQPELVEIVASLLDRISAAQAEDYYSRPSSPGLESMGLGALAAEALEAKAERQTFMKYVPLRPSRG